MNKTERFIPTSSPETFIVSRKADSSLAVIKSLYKMLPGGSEVSKGLELGTTQK